MPEPFERLLKASLREADKGTASLCAYRHAQVPANLCQDTHVLYQRHFDTSSAKCSVTSRHLPKVCTSRGLIDLHNNSGA